MSPILHEGVLSFAAFEARVLAEWKKAWREVADWRGDPLPRIYMSSDWTGMLHMQEIPFEFFHSREAKDELTARFVLMITAGQVSKFAFCNSMMGFKTEAVPDSEMAESHARAELPATILRVMEEHGADNLTQLQRHRPDLIEEAASVAVFDREVSFMNHAVVKRKQGQPPRLVEWGRTPLDQGGLVFGPIQDALR